MKKMTKLQLAEEIVRISKENGFKTFSVEKWMKDTKSFLEFKYEYVLNRANSKDKAISFEVVNEINEVQAMFVRRCQAEKFANEYGYEVREILK